MGKPRQQQTVDYLFTLLPVILKSIWPAEHTHAKGLEPESTPPHLRWYCHESVRQVLQPAEILQHPRRIENGRYTSVVLSKRYPLSRVLLCGVRALHHLLPEDQSRKPQHDQSQLPQLRSLESLQLRLWCFACGVLRRLRTDVTDLGFKILGSGCPERRKLPAEGDNVPQGGCSPA